MVEPSVMEAEDLVEFLTDVAKDAKRYGATLDMQIQQWWTIVELAQLVRGQMTCDELSECTKVFIEEVRSLDA